MDQEKVHLKQLLIDTISLLCKNGLSYNQILKIEGVIGITVDQTAFIVHIDQEMSEFSDGSVNVREVEGVDLQIPSLNDKDNNQEPKIDLTQECFGTQSDEIKMENSCFELEPSIEQPNLENTTYGVPQLNMPKKSHNPHTPRKRPHRRSHPMTDYKTPINDGQWFGGDFPHNLAQPGDVRFDENNVTKWEPGEALPGYFEDDENSSANNSFAQDQQSFKKLRSSSPKLRPFACQYPDCGRTFIRKDHLVRHQRSYHGKQWGVDSQVVFYCNHCNRQFYKTFSLNRHMAEAHGIINQT